MDETAVRPEAPILLLTKLHPPFVPAQTVARERLFARLRERRPLTLVAGPAGFGKSTLLAAWLEAEAGRRPAAWVTLDEADDDVVLVLDDFHRLADADGVAWFAAHLPPGVQLVLATRTDPGIPLATLRGHGQLLELRADALRLTDAEADEFLNGRLGLGLSRADVELLVARTEGWPAGVYLAALSLAGTKDRHAFVAAFDGTSAHVVDFLATEVLAAHPPDLQAFMLRTSVLERLCAPLCDAGLAEPGSAARLDSLARSDLFLLPLDDRRGWYRYHHLFAQLLAAEVERAFAAAPDLADRVRWVPIGEPVEL